MFQISLTVSKILLTNLLECTLLYTYTKKKNVVKIHKIRKWNSRLYWVHYRLAGERFNPKFILKCDDDNLVNIFELENYMDTLDMYDDEIVCAVREEAVPARLYSDKK